MKEDGGGVIEEGLITDPGSLEEGNRYKYDVKADDNEDDVGEKGVDVDGGVRGGDDENGDDDGVYNSDGAAAAAEDNDSDATDK